MTPPLTIVIPDDFPPVYAGQPEVDQLRELGDVQLFSDRSENRAELRRRLLGARFVVNVRAYTSLDADMLSSLSDLAMIAVFGTGTDNIDLDTATRLGIAVTNAPGANARSVAEHAIALMLAVARAIPRHDQIVRQGEWRHIDGMELHGKTLGVVGLGNIGRQIAGIGSALGMRVLAWSPTRDPDRATHAGVKLVDLDDLLLRADVVSLSIALSERTRGLIGERELALMRPSAILVNTARGALVDEGALVGALQDGRLRGAGLDVFAEEPVSPENPLLKLANLVLTPHSGWMTTEARQRVLAMPVFNIQQFIAGHPVNVVNTGWLQHARFQP